MANAYPMPKSGDVIAGKYRIERIAGEGGMGVVYAAEHLMLRKRVAVKVLLPEAATSDAVVERFTREAQAAARIQSDHVARVMDAGSLASGAPFLVMEYLEGCDLEELIELQGTLPPSEVVDIMLQSLEALAHSHAVGIVHRDLKPANLFLACRPDGGSVIKMLDFGISKSVQSRPGDKVLTGQAVLGSPVYMSPEQLRNAKELDGRADLWSLGVVAYELLTGKPPFDGDGVGEIFAAILENDADPVRLKNPAVPVALSEAIQKCLCRKVEDRWADSAQLARPIAPYGSGVYTPLVARTEQVLARAKMLRVVETPTETRQVVDAIEAAALRARSATELALPGAMPDRFSSPSPSPGAGSGPPLRRRARWVGIAMAGVAVAALAAASALHLATPARADRVDLTRAATALEADGPQTLPPEDEEPPMIMDLPSDRPRAAAPPSRSHSTKTTKTPRPKFLDSRE
jgi:eukaryotic-like serine/threonine-protein kinase